MRRCVVKQLSLLEVGTVEGDPCARDYKYQTNEWLELTSEFGYYIRYKHLDPNPRNIRLCSFNLFDAYLHYFVNVHPIPMMPILMPQFGVNYY